MLQFSLEISGHRTADLEAALFAALMELRRGAHHWLSEGPTCVAHFEMSGEPVAHYAPLHRQGLSRERFEHLAAAQLFCQAHGGAVAGLTTDGVIAWVEQA